MIENPEKTHEQKEFEANQNWLGFWNLLLQEDRRQNPHLYKQPKEDENHGSSNNPNKA